MINRQGFSKKKILKMHAKDFNIYENESLRTAPICPLRPCYH